MIRQRYMPIIAALAILGGLLPACSGGGGGSPSISPSPTPTPTPPSRTVFWSPPQYFTDNTPLVPSRDLLGFEIYIKQDPSFGPADSPVATPSPVDTSFNLATLSPLLSRGVTYYVSLRTVTAEGMKSDFSAVAPFSMPQ